MCTYNFSTAAAEQDDSALWQLQQFLLQECESRFGEKDKNKKIYQPIFKSDGPYIINSTSFDGAIAALSDNSRAYWPTTLYELAHETVHLLNPVVDYTNYLEEGMAVEFAVEMSKTHTTHAMQPRSEGRGPYYQNAWQLVRQLPSPIYDSAKQIRTTVGSLGAASASDLISIFPTLESNIANQLAEECNFGASVVT